jgi:hypothetical protein
MCSRNRRRVTFDEKAKKHCGRSERYVLLQHVLQKEMTWFQIYVESKTSEQAVRDLEDDLVRIITGIVQKDKCVVYPKGGGGRGSVLFTENLPMLQHKLYLVRCALDVVGFASEPPLHSKRVKQDTHTIENGERL